jgi:Uma2 family endonuclease
VAGGGHDYIAYRLVLALGPYVEDHNLGAITLSQAGYDVTRPGEAETVRIPDLAFVRKERVPAEDSPEWSRFWPLAPDLVVEVVSPSQHRPEMQQRARGWIERGTQLVWVVWPAAKTVDAGARAQGDSGPVATLRATLTEADQLDGLHVIPGFVSPVAQIFKGLR